MLISGYCRHVCIRCDSEINWFRPSSCMKRPYFSFSFLFLFIFFLLTRFNIFQNQNLRFYQRNFELKLDTGLMSISKYTACREN